MRRAIIAFAWTLVLGTTWLWFRSYRAGDLLSLKGKEGNSDYRFLSHAGAIEFQPQFPECCDDEPWFQADVLRQRNTPRNRFDFRGYPNVCICYQLPYGR